MSQRSQSENNDTANTTHGSSSTATAASAPPARPAGSTPSGPAIALGSGGNNEKKRNLRPILLGVGIPLAIIILLYGLSRYRYGQWHISTDDAYVTSDVVQITPQVAGQVKKVLVGDNQLVQQGQTLALLDDSSYRADLAGAQANLAVAQAAENSALANVRLVSRTGTAQIQQAVGGVTQAQSGEGAAQSGISQAQANVQNARAAVTSSQDNAAAAQAQITNAEATRDQAAQTARAQQTLITVSQARQRSASQGINTAQANLAATIAARARAVQAVASARAGFEAARAGINTAQAGIAAAQANVISAQAEAVRAERDYERAQTLFQGGAAPRSTVDTAEATQKQAQAAVTSAQAALQSANEGLKQAQQTAAARQTDVVGAQAGVEAADAQIAASRAGLSQSRQSVAEAAANVSNARAQYGASVEAVRQAETGITGNQARYAAARDAILQAQSNVAAQQALQGGAVQNLGVARGKTTTARGQLASAQTAPNQLAVAIANYRSAHSKVLQAQADVQTAQLNLQRTRLVAPVTGYVTSRIGQEGQQVAIGQALMSVLPRDRSRVWVIANFKETQLGKVREGQKADIEVDALPGLTFKGHVNSLSAATGATTALLPPENASGNFTKVVQRIPVKVTFDSNQPGLDRLRAGMSANPTIATQ